MIDIHTHILPGLDDGSPDMLCSVEMAELAAGSGVTDIIATPHFAPVIFGDNTKTLVMSQLETLKKEISVLNVELELYAGMEVFGTEDVPAFYKDGLLLTLNSTKYLLIEFDFDADTEYMRRILYELLDAGCIPIVAHPERYTALQDRPRAAGSWLQAGIGLQLNKGSFLGRFGRDARLLAHHMLENGMVTCIASDAHGSQVRTTDMTDIEEYITIKYDESLTGLLLDENPGRILNGKPFIKPGSHRQFI